MTTKLSKRDRLRQRLLKTLPRSFVEELSELERPWHANRDELEEQALARWTTDTRDEILAWLRREL